MGGFIVVIVAGCFAKTWRQAMIFGAVAGALVSAALLYAGTYSGSVAFAIAVRVGISMGLSLLTFAMAEYAKTPAK